MTLLKLYRQVLLSLALLVGAASAALADLQSTVSITVDPFQLKVALNQMSATQRAEVLANPAFQRGGMQATFLVSGVKTRMDITDLSDLGPVAIVKSGNPRRAVMLIRSVKRYIILPPGFDRASRMSQADVQVTPTDETKTLLGHVARRYQLTVSDRGVTESGEIWAASDLPALPSGLFPQSPLIQQVWGNVQGMPLEMTMSLSLPSLVTLKYRVLTLSTAGLPASTFAIPAGYKPTKD